MGLAFVSLAVPATAQSLLPTQGQVVAQNGDAPNGVAVGETFSATPTTSAFATPVISRDGNLLFRGQLVGASTTTLNNRALFMGHTKDDLTMVLRAGVSVPVPALPNSVPNQISASSGLPFSSNVFGNQRISPLGDLMLFHTQLWDNAASPTTAPGLDGLVHSATAGAINDSFMLWGPAGSLLVLAQQNVTTMPGGAKTIFTSANFSHQSTALNSAGTAIFKSDVIGGDTVGITNNTAWLRGIPGALNYFLREGDLLFGGTVGVGSNGLGFNCMQNEAGDVLHDVTLSTSLGSTPATAANDKVLLLTPASSGVHTLLAREGDVAPDALGAPMPGFVYGTPSPAGLGQSGTAAFATSLNNVSTDSAIFVGVPGSVFLAARSGDIVPGTGGLAMNVVNVSSLGYSENHGVLFACTLAAAPSVQTDSVLVLAKPGVGLTLIAREGDAIPGLPGWFFGSSDGSSNFGSASQSRINDRGQVVFQLRANQGVPSSSNAALCSWDPLHGLQLQLFGDTVSGDVWGGGMVWLPGLGLQFDSGDGNTLALTENGDFVMAPLHATGPGFIARGHVGSLNGTPSAVPVAGGVPHVMTLDVTPTYGNQFYFILATGLGTDVGFPHPLNFGITVPIDYDGVWTSVSQAWVNTALWTNTLFVTDANGQPLGGAPISFNMPPGFPGFLGTTLKHSALLFDGALVGTYATEPTTCYLY